MMNRREALSRVALIMGGTVLGAEAFLSGCTTGTTGLKFSQDDISFLNEVAETILPATGTPGAKEAKVGEFMTVIVNDCYEAKDQTAFMEGMKALQFKDSKAKMGKVFMEASPAERTVFLTELDKQAAEFQKNKKARRDEALLYYVKRINPMGILQF